MPDITCLFWQSSFLAVLRCKWNNFHYVFTTKAQRWQHLINVPVLSWALLVNTLKGAKWTLYSQLHHCINFAQPQILPGKICTEWILVRYSEGPLFRKSAVALNPNHNHNPIAWLQWKQTFGIAALRNSGPVPRNVRTGKVLTWILPQLFGSGGEGNLEWWGVAAGDVGDVTVTQGLLSAAGSGRSHALDSSTSSPQPSHTHTQSNLSVTRPDVLNDTNLFYYFSFVVYLSQATVVRRRLKTKLMALRYGMRLANRVAVFQSTLQDKTPLRNHYMYFACWQTYTVTDTLKTIPAFAITAGKSLGAWSTSGALGSQLYPRTTPGTGAISLTDVTPFASFEKRFLVWNKQYQRNDTSA